MFSISGFNLYGSSSDPATTSSIKDYISLKENDSITYRNFSIIESINNTELLDHNLLDDYIDILQDCCVEHTFSNEEYKKYIYSPDILAYDIYGSTQLDWIILLCNDMIDPKDFNLKTVKLPYASVLNELLSEIYSANSGYISQNRDDNNL